MIMQHPATGEREDAGGAFSLPALLLGPIWFFVRGLPREGVLAVILVAVTLGWGWLAMPFAFPIALRKSLARRGFVAVPGAQAGAIVPPGVSSAAGPAEALALMQHDIARIPVDAGHCMQCGVRTGTSSRPIGFSRVLDKNTEFTGGKIRFTTRANVVRTVLVLCEDCWKPRKGFLGLTRLRAEDYALHPWWGAAQVHGFTTNLDRHEVERYH